MAPRFEKVATSHQLNQQLTRTKPVLLSKSGLTAFGRLCFSLAISKLVPAVPRRSLCPTHAPYTPVAIRTVIRLPTDLSQEKKAPLVLTTLDTLTTRLRKFAFARLSDTHLPQVMPRTFDPTLTTAALYRSSSDWFETRS